MIRNPLRTKKQVNPTNAKIQARLQLGPEMANQNRGDSKGAQRIELIEVLAAALAKRT